MKFLLLSILVSLPIFGYTQIYESEVNPKGIVFPRMNTTQRNALTSIQGQCIYNTDVSLVECFDGAKWLAGGALLVDNDGDTKIQVEESLDEDKIRIDLEGNQRAIIEENNDGALLFGLSGIGLNTNIGFRAGESLSPWSGPTIEGTQNVLLGSGAGSNLITGYQNTFVGSDAAFQSQSGNENVIVGTSAGLKTTGDGNVVIGVKAAGTIGGSTGDRNTLIGYESGFSNSSGEYNIFIGNQSGYNETGSNKLYIENSSSSTPLIFGEFDNNFLKVNGTLHISETAKLEPQTTPPACSSSDEGLLYYNAPNKTLNVCKGSMGWKEVATN